MKKNILYYCLILLLVFLILFINYQGYLYKIEFDKTQYRKSNYFQEYQSLSNPFYPDIRYPTYLYPGNLSINYSGVNFLCMRGIETGIIRILSMNGTEIRKFSIYAGEFRCGMTRFNEEHYSINSTSKVLIILTENWTFQELQNTNAKYYLIMNERIVSFYKSSDPKYSSRTQIDIQSGRISIYIFDSFFNQIDSFKNISKKMSFSIKPFNRVEHRDVETTNDYFWVIVNESTNRTSFNISFYSVPFEEYNFCYQLISSVVLGICILYIYIKYIIKYGKKKNPSPK